MKASRTPVWLLTGYLGSGKTTLLRRWLRDPALARAALVINEIGEVGLDDRLLAQAVDAAALVSNACICCTGLPGLEDALTELWWDRLHRRRPAFDGVVIETTGLADPNPVVAAFERVPLLRERYRLAGVITTVSATAGVALLESTGEAHAQVQAAGLVIVTKVDRADGGALQRWLQANHPAAAQAPSAQASLGWAEALSLLESAVRTAPADRPDAAPAPHGHAAHRHPAAQFVALPEPLDRAALAARIAQLRSPVLRRIKGVVRLDDGRLHSVHWACGDEVAELAAFDGEPPALGLTCIAG